MPFYHKLGNVPAKRHTIFKNGEQLYNEQLFGTIGFDGMSTVDSSISCSSAHTGKRDYLEH